MSNWNSSEKERIQTLLDPLKCKFVGFNVLDRSKSISSDDLKENDLILGYDEYHELYFAWNAHVLRLIDRGGNTQTIKIKENIKIEEIIQPIYPVYQLHKGQYSNSFTKSELRDKMLVISKTFIDEFCKNPFLYLLPNPDDANYNPDVTFAMPGVEYSSYDSGDTNFILTEDVRQKYSCSRVSRNSKFRRRVFERCGNKCAICGISIPCVLQAAHIVAVQDGGSDDPENGIVLCSNHHLMYDAKTYFTIDKDNKKIKLLDESICDHVKDGVDLSEYF